MGVASCLMIKPGSKDDAVIQDGWLDPLNDSSRPDPRPPQT